MPKPCRHKTASLDYTRRSVYCDICCVLIDPFVWLAQHSGLPARLPGKHLTKADKRRQILKEVSAAHDVPVAVLLGQSRKQRVVEARWQAMRRMQIELGYSTTQIGLVFNRDHTTVWHGLRMVQAGDGRADEG